MVGTREQSCMQHASPAATQPGCCPWVKPELQWPTEMNPDQAAGQFWDGSPIPNTKGTVVPTELSPCEGWIDSVHVWGYPHVDNKLVVSQSALDWHQEVPIPSGCNISLGPNVLYRTLYISTWTLSRALLSSGWVSDGHIHLFLCVTYLSKSNLMSANILECVGFLSIPASWVSHYGKCFLPLGSQDSMGAPLRRFREVLIHAQGLHLLAIGDLSISK